MCGRWGSRDEASKADRFLAGSLLSTDPTPVHVAVVCGRRFAAPWSSWQPGLGVGRYGESVPLLLIDRGREKSGPYPTNARDPDQRGPNQRKVLERSLPADCIQLARLQNRSIANQEKALRNKPRRCSIRQSHHHRGTEIRDQVFCVPAECCSCHGVRWQPSESCESNDAANEDCFPTQKERRLYGCSAQCRVHVVHRSRHCRCTDFQ